MPAAICFFGIVVQEYKEEGRLFETKLAAPASAVNILPNQVQILVIHCLLVDILHLAVGLLAPLPACSFDGRLSYKYETHLSESDYFFSLVQNLTYFSSPFFVFRNCCKCNQHVCLFPKSIAVILLFSEEG
jgi:hypothetical protein